MGNRAVSQELIMLGNRIREYRKERGFSQEILAEKSGVSTNTISRIEGGQMAMSVGILQKIVKALGVDANTLKSYIQLCLALSQMAKTVKTASPKPQQNENPKYAMRTWLLRLGFIGDEFKTAREILTKRLAGDTAFRTARV